ncbi:MAG: patatin-like phospholipase family protein, partial [Chloroflexota bacterium]
MVFVSTLFISDTISPKMVHQNPTTSQKMLDGPLVVSCEYHLKGQSQGKSDMQLPEYLQKLLKDVELALHTNLYRNMVFKGGGMRGIAYMGALEQLEPLNFLHNIERVAGASAGAITAVLMSFRLSVADTISLFNTLDFN